MEKNIFRLSVLLIGILLLSNVFIACKQDKKQGAEQQASTEQTIINDSENKEVDNQNSNLIKDESSRKESLKLKPKEKEAIQEKVSSKQKEFEKQKKKIAEEKRKASKYKEDSCDKLIVKIDKAVAEAISNPDNEENLNFLYEINQDQKHADCRKDIKYNKKFQDLMQKWDES